MFYDLFVAGGPPDSHVLLIRKFQKAVWQVSLPKIHLEKNTKKHQTTIRCIGVVCLGPIRFSFTKKSGLFWFTNKHLSNKQHSHTIRSLPMSALVQTWTAGETDGFCWVPNLLAEISFSNFMLKKKKHVKFHRKK